ncbi:MAG: phosphoribosylaminoimidazolesuccinocarboxamide synthase [Limnochordia bacterium]|jgi:phosphoribosylaminoimidazole-succinocarboxamide synthase
MVKGELIYRGKAKAVYATDDPDVILFHFTDDVPDMGTEEKRQVAGKGELNNRINGQIFELLTEHWVPNHFLRRLGERETLVRNLEMIPLEVVVRNIAAGPLVSRLGWQADEVLPRPIVEFYLKSDELGDPLVNESHIAAMKLARVNELNYIRRQSLVVNQILQGYLKPRGLRLVDFKLEFGRFHGQVLLGDEISLDTVQLLDDSGGIRWERFPEDGELYHMVGQRLF